jgi:hypothetical protein
MDPLVHEDFNWDNEWVDSLHVVPEGGRGCECDLTWDLEDEKNVPHEDAEIIDCEDEPNGGNDGGEGESPNIS